MRQKRAIKIVVPDRPLRAGSKELIELQLRLPDAVQIVESSAIFEGRCRASFSGQDSLHSLVDEQLHVPYSALHLPTSKGVDVIPEGNHRLPVFVTIPHHLPGTFTGKSGAIAYRIVVKLKVKRFSSGEEGNIDADKTVDVLGKAHLDQHPSYAQPVTIDRHVKKKLFFMSRLDANVKIEIDRAAYVVGEHILVTGEISNAHPSHVIKHVAVELRQHIVYTSGDAQRHDSRLITRLIIGSVPPAEKFPVHHSLQIPADCYPSLTWNSNPIQVSYELLLTTAGNFEIGIPVFIGNCAASSRRSIMYPESTCGSTYCVPASEFSFAGTIHAEPPPYSTTHKEPLFVPIHMLNTPYRAFAPAYSMPMPMGFFHSGPPKYEPPPPRFLKIEEIE